MKRAATLLLPTLIAASGLTAQEPKIPPDQNPTTTESGLKYSVLKEGEGQPPEMGDVVRVNYTGWLPNGTVFDASSRHGGPAEFMLGQVIQGWNEGLQLMRPGAIYKFTIPYQLAYGEEGHGPIPAKATLIFQVELLSVKKHPDFQPLDEDKAKEVDKLKVQVLQEGQGEPPPADTPVAMDIAAFNQSGKILQWTHDQPMMARPQDITLPVLKEVATKMKPGAVWLVQAPPEMAWGQQNHGPDLPPGSTTIWRVKLTHVFREPKFEKPDLDAMQTTASGLKYQVLEKGEGDSPGPNDKVTVHYVGWLMDGTKFDSSYDSGRPATFGLSQVIPGWTEGLQLMKPGARYRFVIPSDLGYGKAGSPPKIPADATLVFDVDLLGVQ